MEPQNVDMDRAPPPPPPPPSAPDHFSRFDPQILETMHKDLADVLKNLQDELEVLLLNWRDRLRLERGMKIRSFQGPLSQLLEDEKSPLSANQNLESQMATLNELVQQRQEKIRLLGLDADKKSTLTLQTLSVAYVKIREDIKAWKAAQQSRVSYQQKKVLEDEQLSLRLDEIQRHGEVLCDSLLKLRSNLNNMDGFRKRMNEYKLLANIFKSDRRVEAEALLKELVTASFIVEVQPPQVVEHSSPVGITVRFLIGNTFSTNCLGQEVTASVAYEDDVRFQRTSITNDSEDSSSLLNNTNTFKCTEHTKRVVVTFSKLQINQFRRKRKTALEEAFWLQFRTTVRIADLVFNLSVLSTPFVAINHANQYSFALAKIFWNKVICNQHGSVAGWAFNRKEKVAWSGVVPELQKLFHDKTACSLSAENLAYLKAKLYREHNVSDNDHITSSKFYREILPERNFTFWDWFQSAAGLFKVDSNLKDLWNDNLVMGFVSRARTEELLKRCGAGTILLRFSDSCLGGLTVACISADRMVFSVAPFTPDDLRNRSLVNRLLDFKIFKFAYPDISLQERLEVFVKPVDMTSEQIDKRNRGYIKPLMRPFLPGVTDSLGFMDSAPSPFLTLPPEHANSEAVYEDFVEDVNNWPDDAEVTSVPSNLSSISTPIGDFTVELEAIDDESQEQVYLNLDNQTTALAASAVQSAEVSSNFPAVDCMDVAGALLSSDDSTDTAMERSNGATEQGAQKVARRKVNAGFIMKKRDRDKSKSKRKKSLAKWAKDLTNTCGCRVFLLVDNLTLCDSLEGGKDAIEIPDSVKHEFARREPKAVPDEVLKRLFQNLRITQRTSLTGIKRFKPSESPSPSTAHVRPGPSGNRQPSAIDNRRSSADLRCRVCDSIKDPFSQEVEVTVTTVWLKCKNLLDQCNYYVHASCAGIYLSNQIETQSIPFFCPSHMREELLRRT